MTYVYRNTRTNKLLELQFPIGKAPDETVVGEDRCVIDHKANFQGQSFVLKGGGWPGQDLKRKTQMTRNNVEAGQRTRKTWGKPKGVVPNYAGQETGSWDEAATLAEKNRSD